MYVMIIIYLITECVHLRRDYPDKDDQPIKLNISSFLEVCHTIILILATEVDPLQYCNIVISHPRRQKCNIS